MFEIFRFNDCFKKVAFNFFFLEKKKILKEILKLKEEEILIAREQYLRVNLQKQNLIFNVVNFLKHQKMKNKIGIIGSGIVGVTLANGFIQHGYEVMIGTNNSSKHEELKTKTNNKVAVGSFTEVAQFGRIIVLAVKGAAALESLQKIGIENLQNKTVIDTTNPIAALPPVNGVLQFTTSLNESMMEQLQAAMPHTNFVKAFNSVGSAFMVNPDFGGEKPTMFICGNNELAKDEVKIILQEFGWDIADMGKAEAARAIEPLCMLWCIPGMLHNQWSHAFKLLKK